MATTNYVGRIVTTKTSAGATKETFTRDWNYVNPSFERIDGSINYIVGFITSTSRFSMIQLKFRMKWTTSIPSGTVANWGKFVLELQTKTTAGQIGFANNLGRFANNNDEIDCVCTCGACNVGFKCTVTFGAADPKAPVQILMEPQAGFSWWNGAYCFNFPKIKMPAIDNLSVKARFKAFQHNGGGVFQDVNEILEDFVFYTIPDASVINTGLTAPVFTPNTVGSPSTAVYPHTMPFGNVVVAPYTKDRFILETTTAEHLIDIPRNPNNPYPPLLPVFITTATGGTVYLYPLAKWVEIVPSVQFNIGAVSLTLQNFKNMPYEIPGGVQWNLYNFIRNGLRAEHRYLNQAMASAHALAVKNPITQTVAIVQQPNSLEFTFQPYNKLPTTGQIVIDFPPGAFVFDNPYCKVPSGLDDPSCDIIPGNPGKLIVKNWRTAYNPLNADGSPNAIKITLDLQNPVAPMTPSGQFSLKTMWNQAPGDLVDSDPAYGTITVNGGNILDVTLDPRYEHPYPICGGRRGPITFSFKLRFTYKFPTDYFQINFYNTITMPAGYEEILCYFREDGQA